MKLQPRSTSDSKVSSEDLAAMFAPPGVADRDRPCYSFARGTCHRGRQCGHWQCARTRGSPGSSSRTRCILTARRSATRGSSGVCSNTCSRFTPRTALSWLKFECYNKPCRRELLLCLRFWHLVVRLQTHGYLCYTVI